MSFLKPKLHAQCACLQEPGSSWETAQKQLLTVRSLCQIRRGCLHLGG